MLLVVLLFLLRDRGCPLLASSVPNDVISVANSSTVFFFCRHSNEILISCFCLSFRSSFCSIPPSSAFLRLSLYIRTKKNLSSYCEMLPAGYIKKKSNITREDLLPSLLPLHWARIAEIAQSASAILTELYKNLIDRAAALISCRESLHVIRAMECFTETPSDGVGRKASETRPAWCFKLSSLVPVWGTKHLLSGLTRKLCNLWLITTAAWNPSNKTSVVWTMYAMYIFR